MPYSLSRQSSMPSNRYAAHLRNPPKRFRQGYTARRHTAQAAHALGPKGRMLVGGGGPSRHIRIPSGGAAGCTAESSSCNNRESSNGRASAMGFTAVFQEVSEGYIAFVEEIPGANTQGATLEEARENLHEAVELVLAANRELSRESIGAAKVIREPLKIAG